MTLTQYLAVSRRFEAAKLELEKAWAMCKRHRAGDELRARYIALLRRCDRLQSVLKTQSLQF